MKTLEKIKKQDWIDINDIMQIEMCKQTKARRKMKQARDWARENEGKEYPERYILAEDYFAHIWLVPVKKDTKKAPVSADA